MGGIEITEIGSAAELDAAFDIRREVFCREQGVAEDEEIDGRDGECRHYLVRRNGDAVGTARTRPLGPGDVKIERVAVLAPHRGATIGRALMTRIMSDISADDGAARMVLNAQTRVEAFYARLGFISEGGVFDEAGIPHVRMVRPPPER